MSGPVGASDAFEEAGVRKCRAMLGAPVCRLCRMRIGAHPNRKTFSTKSFATRRVKSMKHDRLQNAPSIAC